MDAIVLGTSPNAREGLEIALRHFPDAIIATVNAGTQIVPDPHSYGVFEWAAIDKWREEALRLSKRGTKVYTRKGKKLHHLNVDGAIGICDKKYVYDQTRPKCWIWMGAGILMSLIIAHEEEPENLVIVGCEGYDSGEYAEGIERLEGAPVRDEAFCSKHNAKVRNNLKKIIKFHPKTKFHCALEANWNPESLKMNVL